MLTNSKQILTAGDMSQATLTSVAYDLQEKSLAAMQAIYTGSPVGSLQVQGSNDDIHWSAVGSPTAISAAGDVLVNIGLVGFQFMRAVYTKTSGTGALTLIASAK